MDTAFTPYTLYSSLLSICSYRVKLMLSLCGQTYHYRYLDMGRGMHRTPEFVARYNRFAQAPVLLDGDKTLVQSGAILLYLAEKHRQFEPVDPETGSRAGLEWLFWDQDFPIQSLGRYRAVKRGFALQKPDVEALFLKTANDALAFLDAQLADKPWLSGERPSIGDLSVYATIAVAFEGGFELKEYPKVLAWTRRIEALPGYKSFYDLELDPFTDDELQAVATRHDGLAPEMRGGAKEQDTVARAGELLRERRAGATV